MKLLMENWRGFLNEGDSEEIDQLSQMMRFSVEETIAHQVMTHNWKKAWNLFREGYIEGKVDLRLLVVTLDDLLKDEYWRIRKNMINTDWEETLTSAVNFITAGLFDRQHNDFFYPNYDPLRSNPGGGDTAWEKAEAARFIAELPDSKALRLRIYEPGWPTNTKKIIHDALTTSLHAQRLTQKRKKNETPT